jgi:preprotein translocase subunit SecY
MKPKRSLGVRLALTIVPVIALLVARARLLLPGIDDAGVRRLAEPTLGGFGAENVGVFALGVMAFVQAYALVELVALAVPALRRLRHGNPEGRAKLDRAARGFGLVLAVFQAFGIAVSLRALSSTDLVMTTPMPEISVPIVTATLVGGACLSMLVADLVTRQGIVNGLLLLPCIELVLATIDDVRAAVAKGTVAGLWETRHWVIVFGGVALALFAGWAATHGAHDVRATATDAPKEDRTAYRDARALILRPWVPIPSSSFAPYTMAASILMLPATLTNFKLPFKELAAVLERGDLTFTVAYALTMGGLVFLLTRLLHRPAEAEDLARRLGTQVDRSAVIAAQNRALFPSLMFFAVLVVVTHAAGHVRFLHLSLAMLPVIAALVLDGVRAVRIPTDFASVWQERRASAVPVVRAVLESRGIDTLVTGAATNALFQAFAPYAPVTLHVPAADAERATKILRHLLLGEDAPEAAPDERTAPRQTTGWTVRTRAVALGAALLASCGLLGLGLVKPPAPPARTPAKLEVVAVADDVDAFAGIPDQEVPEGIEIRFENAPQGTDRLGQRKTERVYYATVPLAKGETVDDAIRRGDAWTKTKDVGPGRRIAWEPTYDWDDEGGQLTPSGARTFVIEGNPVLTNQDIVEAMPSVDAKSATPEVYIAITLTPEAGERFGQFTRERVNRRLAIVLDGRINSAPVIRSAIDGGRISITMGQGDVEKQLKEARALAGGLSQR